ncbi:MAG: hypothetical protein IPM92_14690 [Saprospiraceae bacterium]|nr:hypothetical protein [Saprospiraceae bacterium]
MKNMYYFLFSFIFLGFSQSYAQVEATETGGNQRSESVGIKLNLRKSAAAPSIIQTEDLRSLSRTGLTFQLVDADDKVVARGERRVKYNEKDGTVDVDLLGLPDAPKGRNYRMRVTRADKAVVTNVDLK